MIDLIAYMHWIGLSFSIAAQYTSGIPYPIGIMSYTAEIQGSITEATIVAARQSTLSKTSFEPEAISEKASATELFSYAFCCAGQGLLWALFLVVVVTVPAFISQGIALGLP